MTTDRELMQQALDAMLNFPNDISDEMFESIRVLRARLSQPEQQHSEQWWRHEVSNAWAEGYEKGRASVKQPEQEPVAWWHDMGDVVDLNVSGRGVPLYTTPPQREWQGLTEGETIDLALSAFALPEVSSETREKIHRDLVIAMNDQDSRLMLFAANIEAKLKEKNT